MGRIGKLKEAIVNPPGERLAAIEYRSHFLQILGITVVSIILIIRGFWYIIFAFIFGIGVSYSAGMNAYRKYKIIVAHKKPEKLEEFEMDVSLTRRRSKIIKHVFGKGMNLISTIVAVVVSFLIIPQGLSRITLSIVYPILIALIYVVLYYGMAYWIAYPYYKEELKGGKTHGKKKERRD